MRLLMLGLDNAGKTTVVKKFNGEDIDLISPTLGFNIKTLEYSSFKLNIWDVGGQTSLRSYWRNYFESTDGLIWVVDSSDRARLLDCKAELQVLLQQEVRLPSQLQALCTGPPQAHVACVESLRSGLFTCGARSQRLAGASLLVFANKQDIEGAYTAEEIRKVLSYNVSHNCPPHPSSPAQPCPHAVHMLQRARSP